jgi:hypothetical protein
VHIASFVVALVRLDARTRTCTLAYTSLSSLRSTIQTHTHIHTHTLVHMQAWVPVPSTVDTKTGAVSAAIPSSVLNNPGYSGQLANLMVTKMRTLASSSPEGKVSMHSCDYIYIYIYIIRTFCYCILIHVLCDKCNFELGHTNACITVSNHTH